MMMASSSIKKSAIILISLLSFLISLINAKTQTQRLSSFYEFGNLKNKIEKRSHYDNLHEEEIIQVVYSSEEEEEERVKKESDEIERLPGQPRVQFKQYGGYVTVDPSAGRAFFYYFAEAQTSHNTSPLLLWLNGGPGCSSLGYGAMEEMGPFRVHSDGKTLYSNTFSWNHAANVLFVESPAGVGFSYSNTSADLAKNGDRRTATDNYIFLLKWLERFPEYKDRDFYISGESYAGHYGPQLAHTILYHNKNANNTIINLKGILIGNGVLNEETDRRGRYEYYGSHTLISMDAAQKIVKYCNFSPAATTQTHACQRAYKHVIIDFGTISDYNIYAPSCINYSLTLNPTKASLLDMDPCSDNYVEAYMNRAEVQKALHAKPINIVPYGWQLCSFMEWQDQSYTVLPLLKELMANRLRVWIYSGDTDANVPFTSTMNSIREMKLPIKTAWRPWYLGHEVGGYTQMYEGELTFATVRGAGHEVPSYQPARALSLIKYFLAGTPLPISAKD